MILTNIAQKLLKTLATAVFQRNGNISVSSLVGAVLLTFAVDRIEYTIIRMGKGNKSKPVQKPVQKEPAVVTPTPAVTTPVESTTKPTAPVVLSTVPNDKHSKVELPVSPSSSSQNALQLENEELKRTIALLSMEKEKISLELKDREIQLQTKNTDLTLMVSYVDDMDAQIEVLKTELIGTEVINSIASENLSEDHSTSAHVKRMVDLISVLANMKAQLTNRTNELSSANQKIEELHSGIQTLQTKHNHLVIEYKKEREQLLALTEEISLKNRDMEKLEEETAVMRGKYQEVLQGSVEDLESFRGELSDALSLEWMQKEVMYLEELSQLRQSNIQLEEDKKQAIESCLQYVSVVEAAAAADNKIANGVEEWSEADTLYQREVRQMQDTIERLKDCVV